MKRLSSLIRLARIISALIAIAVTPVAAALATGSFARPATKSERAAIMTSFVASDGNSSEVHGVYVSKANSSLGVVCVRTPEIGSRAFVFRRVHRSWRYVTSGSPGRSGNTADRRIELACG